jgi:hypothetical protein
MKLSVTLNLLPTFVQAGRPPKVRNINELIGKVKVLLQERFLCFCYR